MSIEDFDKTLEAIENLCDIIEDVIAATEESSAGGEEITWTETTSIVLNNGLKAVKSIASFKEIGRGLKDTDVEEVKEALEILIQHFGGSPEAKQALEDIKDGAGKMYSGVTALIALRKNKE
jgi:hypothetical protein